MTPIEKLKRLEASATPRPWAFNLSHPDIEKCVIGVQSAPLTQALRNLAPELIALWEAAQGTGPKQNGFEWMDGVDEALAKLNARAAEVLKPEVNP